MRLYGYWRSSATYRVRIALELKGIRYTIVPVSLAPGVAEQRQDEYRERNPQMLVPYLEDGEVAIAQSLAILEYLEETYTDKPLLPESPAASAAVRSFCSAICCDIHPLNNLRVLQYLKQQLGISDEQRDDWYAHWVLEGFRSAELVAADSGGPFVFGERPTLADACLVPQMYNAHRFKVPLEAFPHLLAVEKHCSALPEFVAAAPENQPDASA